MTSDLIQDRGKMRWEDGAIYGLVLAGIYLLVGVLFFYAGKSKVIDGNGMPDPLKAQFKNTFLDTFPGLDASWWILGILECLVFILIVASLVRLEFLPSRHKPFLLMSLAMAIFTFSILAMGQNLTGQNQGVAELYLYGGGTGVLMGLVLVLPPRRPVNWLSNGR